MPSQANSSLGGFNRAVSTVGVSQGRATVKSGSSGASGLINTVGLPRDAAFDATSNNDLAVMPFASGTPLHYATGTSSTFGLFGQPRHLRKKSEVGVSNLMESVQTDGLNQKTADKIPLQQGSGVQILRDGRFVTRAGAAVTPNAFGISSTGYEIVSGSGDTDAKGDRVLPTDYNYRIGLTDVDKTLAKRTQ